MSLLADSPSSLTYSISSSSPRKRTFSFSLPPTRSEYEPPSKIARMQTAALHYHAFANATSTSSSLAGSSRAAKGAGVSVATSASATTTTTGIVTPGTDGVPYHRSLKYYKDQRERRRALLQRTPSSPPLLTTPPPTISTPSASPTPATAAPSPIPKAKSGPGAVPMTPSRPRTSSPLAPTPTPLAPRASFPRSRAPPDLHKQAVVARMRTSPAGQQILRMGPRLAVSMLAATQELERMVALEQQREKERQHKRATGAKAGRFPEDVVMREVEEESEVSVSLLPPALSRSWVIVPGEDWEMVDCAA